MHSFIHSFIHSVAAYGPAWAMWVPTWVVLTADLCPSKGDGPGLGPRLAPLLVHHQMPGVLRPVIQSADCHLYVAGYCTVQSCGSLRGMSLPAPRCSIHLQIALALLPGPTGSPSSPATVAWRVLLQS